MSIIYGERVRLRAVERDDVAKFHEWVNDPEADSETPNAFGGSNSVISL